MTKKRAPNLSVSPSEVLISMTGFGKTSAAEGRVELEVEIKCANSRFLDLALKLPKNYGEYETLLRNEVSAALDRGRVEVTVQRTLRADSGSAGQARFNATVFNALYSKGEKALQKAVGKKISAAARERLVCDLLTRHEVLDIVEEGGLANQEEAILRRIVQKALAHVVTMRKAEGIRLAHDIRSRLATVADIRSQIETIAGTLPNAIRERLDARLKKLGKEVEVDPARVAQEVVLLLDRLDITEELVRLASHFEQFSQTMRQSPNGRKLDFLLQEMGREINTIGSKAQNAEVQRLVVDAKVELEKIREQVQNLV